VGHDWLDGPRIGRRELIIGAASLAALAACSGDDGSRAGGPTSPGTSPGTAPVVRNVVDLPTDPFGLGVASGDPRPDSVILWSRLALDPLAADGSGGMAPDPVDVVWEVATDEDFTDVVAAGVATARPEAGHSVHVEATGLDPATDHWYRFDVGGWTSPTGRTRTLAPSGTSPDRFALAIANCQWLDAGRYGAYRHLVDEDLDLVLFLGDYIYEYPGERVEPKRVPESLADFRLRYASYRLDPLLQGAHARFPFVCTWDDHEVLNNYMGDTDPTGLPAETILARRAKAYRAWWEFLPVRVGPPDGPDLPIHHTVDVGDLARIYVLDTRQHADPPPCRDDPDVAYDDGDCPARLTEDRSLLGGEQERWFGDATTESTATWNVLGNPVVLSGVDAGTGDEPEFYLDSWDGFPDARARLVDALAGTSNPVVLTGDYHAGLVFDLHRRPFDPTSEVVATELVSPAISSTLFDADVSARTPQLRQQIDAHGYLTVAFEPERLTARFRVLDDVQDVDSPIRTAATWRIAAGSPRAVEEAAGS
jgi:alkaline phosphatase D